MARVHAAAVPLVHASDLRALLDFYCGTLGLRLEQEIPGALAVLSLGRARLQIWQREGLKPRHCHIALTAARGGIFRLHACLATRARCAVEEQGPVLRSWGIWEFTVRDPQGNRVFFSEPACDFALEPRGASDRKDQPRPH